MQPAIWLYNGRPVTQLARLTIRAEHIHHEACGYHWVMGPEQEESTLS